MANEITANLRLGLANGLLTDQGPDLGSFRITQNSPLLWKDVIPVTTVDTNISSLIANITTVGICYFVNYDTTNYVQWGPGSGGVLVPFGLLKPVQASGDPEMPALFRLDPATQLRMKAHTATCKVLVCVYDD
jgi:hypothetical protein